MLGQHTNTFIRELSTTLLLKETDMFNGLRISLSNINTYISVAILIIGLHYEVVRASETE